MAILLPLRYNLDDHAITIQTPRTTGPAAASLAQQKAPPAPAGRAMHGPGDGYVAAGTGAAAGVGPSFFTMSMDSGHPSAWSMLTRPIKLLAG